MVLQTSKGEQWHRIVGKHVGVILYTLVNSLEKFLSKQC